MFICREHCIRARLDTLRRIFFGAGRVMKKARDNPDRNFSADQMDDREAQELRDLLKSSEIASVFDEVVRKRVGEVIGRSAFDPRRQLW